MTAPQETARWDRLLVEHHSWAIESRRHHCLEVTPQEDLSQVLTPHSALGVGMLRRVLLRLSHATVDMVRQANP